MASALTFLDLPPEIRDIIYSYVLTADRALHMSRSKSTRHGAGLNYDWSDHAIQPGVLHASHQIHQEATQVLLRCNVFSFINPDDLRWFLKKIGSIGRSSLRSIEINMFDLGRFGRTEKMLSFSRSLTAPFQLKVVNQSKSLLASCVHLRELVVFEGRSARDAGRSSLYRHRLPFRKTSAFTILKDLRGLKATYIKRSEGSDDIHLTQSDNLTKEELEILKELDKCGVTASREDATRHQKRPSKMPAGLPLTFVYTKRVVYAKKGRRH